MMDLKLYTASVVSIDDPSKKGKIQIKVLPELKDVQSDLLPWAVPFTMIQGAQTLSNDLPETGSTIRCLVNKSWKRFYYLPNRYFESIFDFTKISTTLGPIGVSSTYKDLKFRLYTDGGLEFHNNSTGEHGFIHKSGSYQVFTSSGEIKINGGPSSKIIITNGITDLKTELSSLIDKLNAFVTVGSPVTQLTSPATQLALEASRLSISTLLG